MWLKVLRYDKTTFVMKSVYILKTSHHLFRVDGNLWPVKFVESDTTTDATRNSNEDAHDETTPVKV